MAGPLSRLRSFFASSAYRTAGSGQRARRWNPPNPGPNAALLGAQSKLQAQSRDAQRNNAIAGAAIERLTSNVIGTGIKPKLTDDATASLWLRWTDVADAAGVVDFYGLQSLVFSTVVSAGECFVRLRNRLPVDGLPVPLQLEVLEPEFCPITKNETAPNGNLIRQGVEFDRVIPNRRTGYWMHRRHPADDTVGAVDANETVFIPASEVLHVFLPVRPGQIRGEPWLTRALARIDQLEAYDNAELTRKQVAAMFVGFIRKSLPEGLSLEDLKGTWGEDAEIENMLGAVSMEPGTMQVLQPGEDVTFAEPSDVGNQYEIFMRTQLRAIASSIGLLYEQLSGDYSQVNDRTWRAAVSEFRRRCERWQHQLVVYQLCRPVWTRWVDLAVLARALPSTVDALEQPVWTPQRWDYINPVQDVEAQRAAVLAGFTSRAAVVSERGEDVTQVDRENAADADRAEELGLRYDSDGRVVNAEAPAPVVQAPPPAEPPQPDARALAAELRAAFAAAAPPPAPPPDVTVVLPDRVTVDAVKAVGPTYTEVEARDAAGRITSMLIKPSAGAGPIVRRIVTHDENGRVASTFDEPLTEN